VRSIAQTGGFAHRFDALRTHDISHFIQRLPPAPLFARGVQGCFILASRTPPRHPRRRKLSLKIRAERGIGLGDRKENAHPWR
jgi:hypothetical protein